MTDQQDGGRQLVVSYLVLRKAIGYLGFTLPFVLAGGAALLFRQGIQPSVSSYYYTGMRDVFVGILCAIAVFLLSYKGYDRRDDLAGDLACVCALGVALFPTTPDLDPTPLQKVLGTVHIACAASFFLILAYFSLALFTKTDPSGTPTRRKLQRNTVYRVCGLVILGALALMVVVVALPESAGTAVKQLAALFWLEALAVIAFGASWLIKGERLLADEEPHEAER